MPDLQTTLLIAVAAVTIGSSLLIFVSRRLMHAVLGLTGAFLGSALMFLLLNQPFMALLQLFVFVGGLSTYLMVAIASEGKGKPFLRVRYFVPAAIAVSLALYFLTSNVTAAQQFSGTDMSSTFLTALSNNYPILFAAVTLLFAAAIGSVLFIKKFAAIVT